MDDERIEELRQESTNKYKYVDDSASKCFKKIYPSTYKNLSRNHDFEEVILHDSGLLLVSTDKQEFERELDKQELVELLDLVLRRGLDNNNHEEEEDDGIDKMIR